MKQLLKNPKKYYTAKERPSGHQIGESFANRRDGAIPPNLLQIPNSTSNSHYLRSCKALDEKSHPARFPSDLPKFFIEFLTDPGDLVVDIFSGSNTTGQVAEDLGRRWLSIELDKSYAALSAVRFMEGWSTEKMAKAIEQMRNGKHLEFEARTKDLFGEDSQADNTDPIQPNLLQL